MKSVYDANKISAFIEIAIGIKFAIYNYTGASQADVVTKKRLCKFEIIIFMYCLKSILLIQIFATGQNKFLNGICFSDILRH